MYVCVCACVCVYLMNNVYLCHSGRGLVCGSVREGCTLRLSDTQTHTDSTQRDTHMALCLRIKTLFHWLRGWCDWSVLSGGGWGCSGHSHGWFCQAQDKSCTVGRSCLLQYPACLLVHPRWSRHQFQIFYRINSRRTRRVVTSRFPGNSLGGFHKVKLLNFPQPLCARVSPTFISLWKWNHGARLSVLLSDSQETVQCLHRSQQMLQNQNVLVWLIEWIYYLTTLHLV